jgi:antitoxin component of MazEF toxin-antitoxin module
MYLVYGIAMTKHINKMGKSYVVYLPKDLVDELGWVPKTREVEGTPIMVEREGNRLVIRRYQLSGGGT